jgi:hypothetical protein
MAFSLSTVSSDTFTGAILSGAGLIPAPAHPKTHTPITRTITHKKAFLFIIPSFRYEKSCPSN